MVAKNHGIKNVMKEIMEFELFFLEKSWNFYKIIILFLTILFFYYL